MKKEMQCYRCDYAIKKNACGTQQPVTCDICHSVYHMSCGAAPSRGWVAGRLWNPPPPSPPSPPLLGWLAGWRAPGKQPKYVVHHCTASSHAWCAYGDGFARVGGVGHLSRTPLPHTPSCLAFGTSHKDQEHNVQQNVESPHQTNVQLQMLLLSISTSKYTIVLNPKYIPSVLKYISQGTFPKNTYVSNSSFLDM